MSKRKLFIAGASVALVSAFFALRSPEARTVTTRREVRSALPDGATKPEMHDVRAVPPRLPVVASAAPAAPERAAKPTRLEELKRTREQDALIWNAEQKAVSECMAERGFAYTAIPFDDTDDLDHELSRPDPTDVETAQEHGYGIADAIAEQKRPQEAPGPAPVDVEQMKPERREQFITALLGPRVPHDAMTAEKGWQSAMLPGGMQTHWYADSCYARARERIHGKDYVQNELGTARMQLDEQVSKQLESDEKYQQALDDWRRCMRERGEPQTTPGAAADALSTAYHDKKVSLDELRSRELKLATLEASCYRQTQLEGRTASARARQERAVIEGAPDVVQGIQDAQQRALSRASSLLDKTAVND